MSDSPQFIRTDKAITQALINLLKEKPFEKITVQDILEETPVTRATFYAHYRDKYEIAEKMLEQFFSLHANLRAKLKTSPASRSQDIIHRTFTANYEMANALLKIHTEKVDLRRSLVDMLVKEYTSSSNSPSKETEARIFAQALTEFHLSYLSDINRPDFSTDGIHNIFVSVALALLGLSNDRETRLFLSRKLKQL